MGDLISRQAAIDAIEHRLAEPAYQHTDEDWYVGMNCAESELYDLPSAQPERKTGRWIDDNCSECGQYVYHGDARNYCPNCGTKMEESEDIPMEYFESGGR